LPNGCIFAQSGHPGKKQGFGDTDTYIERKYVSREDIEQRKLKKQRERDTYIIRLDASDT
jgi:hypothetical protein